MEDFGPILWVTVTLAAMIYSSISKAKKAAKKGAAAPQNAPAEAWPMPSMPIPRRQEPPIRPSQAHDSNDTQPSPRTRQGAQNTATPSIEPSYMASTPSSAPESEQTYAERPAEASAASPDKGEIEPQTSFREEFDLRKAIIASEVLRPKFDE